MCENSQRAIYPIFLSLEAMYFLRAIKRQKYKSHVAFALWM